MGDYSRHSPQIWRSFYIEMDSHATEEILKICYFLLQEEMRFCFQRYGEWERTQKVYFTDTKEFNAGTMTEPEHVSFRLIADDIPEIQKFREWLETNNYSWTEGSWDEEWRVKKAYEVGTKLWLVYMKEMRELVGYGEIGDPDKYKGFVLQMLHGFFNGLDMEYGDEEILISNYLHGLLKRNGFSDGFHKHLTWLNTSHIKKGKMKKEKKKNVAV